MKRNYLLLIVLICASCGNQKTEKEEKTEAPKVPEAPTSVPPKVDTLSSLTQLSIAPVKTFFHAPNNTVYEVGLLDAEADEEALTAAAALNCATDNFSGNDRKACKLSLASATMENFTSLNSFLQSLKPDAQMMADPAIKKDANNKRVAAEKRNVKVKNVFIFAIKRESDNDYHIIIGDGNNHFFNIECSGLPAPQASSSATLKKVRKQIEDFFGELCITKYTTFKPGIKTEITGSLFYDIDHKPGVVGPEGFRPKTAWEIHPISNVIFK